MRADGHFPDGSDHPLGLTIGPWVAWPGQPAPLPDAVFEADPLEDVNEPAPFFADCVAQFGSIDVEIADPAYQGPMAMGHRHQASAIRPAQRSGACFVPAQRQVSCSCNRPGRPIAKPALAS